MSYKENSIINKDLNDAHLTDAQLSEVSVLHHKERRNVSLVLILVILFGFQDFFEDLGDGGDWIMITTDIVYVSIMIGLLAYIWRHVPLARSRQSTYLAQAAMQQRRDAEIWRAQASDLLQGLGQMISVQLTAWQLTTAEQEIAVFLLKGFSLKEIAVIRGTGEPTVRQQAAQIYTKANLSGRAELSAFFLEDLLPAGGKLQQT